MEILERMGLIIASRRAQMCIGQKELADRAGIHRTYISDIERGRRNVTIGTLNKISEVLGISVGELLIAAEAGKTSLDAEAPSFTAEAASRDNSSRQSESASRDN